MILWLVILPFIFNSSGAGDAHGNQPLGWFLQDDLVPLLKYKDLPISRLGYTV